MKKVIWIVVVVAVLWAVFHYWTKGAKDTLKGAGE